MDDSASNRRSIRNVLINRPLQREFTLSMIFIMVTAGTVVGVMIHMTLSGITDGAPQTISRLALERMISDIDSQLIMGTLVVIFVTVILTGVFGVFLLHRVAGPVYRFRQVLNSMAGGQIPREIRLRERDFFKETASELNQVIHLLRQYEQTSKEIIKILDVSKDKPLSSQESARIRKLQSTLLQSKEPTV
jgi:signal transduction histidine kinase